MTSYGPVTSCEGEVTGSFENAKFGRLMFALDKGITFEVATYPPESSRKVLRGSPSTGIPSPDKALRALEEHVTGSGVVMNRPAPRVQEAGEVRREIYAPEEQDLNAEVVAEYRGGRLVELSFSMAL